MSARNDILQVTLRYRDISALFTPGTLTPFSDDFQVYSITSGIEYLVGRLSANPSLKQVEVTILLPSDALSSGLEGRTKDAIGRYCRAQADRHRLEIRAQRWHLIREFTFAVIGLVALLTAARLLYATNGSALALLGDGLTIAGWVLFWFPLETFFYTIRHLRVDERIYERLISTRLTIKASDGEPITDGDPVFTSERSHASSFERVLGDSSFAPREPSESQVDDRGLERQA